MARRFYSPGGRRRVLRALLALPSLPLVASGSGRAAEPVGPGAAAPAPAGAARPSGGTELCSATERHMGVPWTITVHAATEREARAALAAAFAEVKRLDRILSDYDPESELSRLSAAAPTREPVAVGPDLWRVLARAVEIRDASAGAFDPTVGPLTTLWRQARRSGRLPPAARLAAARAAVGPATLRLLPADRAVSLERPGMRLDLGGIGMGYAADRAREALDRHGIAAAMIDASGDVLVSAAPPGRPGWRIAVAPLRAAAAGAVGTDLVLADAAVTTSGDAHQAVEIDGRRYSHVVDPRTGIGVAGPAAVTVIGPDCATADAAATAASVLGPDASGGFLAAVGGCAARFTWQDGEAIRLRTIGPWPAPPAQMPLGPG